MSKIALFTPNNKIPYSEALSSWILDGVFVEENVSGVLAPDGTQTAMRIACDTSSGYHTVAAYIPASGYLIGELLVSEFFWRPGSCALLLHDVRNGTNAAYPIYSFGDDASTPTPGAGFLSTWEASSGGWFRFAFASSLTVNYINSGNLYVFFFLINTDVTAAYQGTSGHDYYLWHPSLSPKQAQPYMPTTGASLIGDCIVLDTEWDSTSGAEKFFDESKTPAGARTRYVYGQRDRIKLNAEFLTARDLHVLNTWWREGTPILMRDADDPFAAINSVFIADSSPPVAKQIKPYADAWAVSIELEGY